MASWNLTSLPYGPFFDTKEEAMRYGVEDLDDARYVSRVVSVRYDSEDIVAKDAVRLEAYTDMRLTSSDADNNCVGFALLSDIRAAAAEIFRRHKCVRPWFSVDDSERFEAPEDTKP